MSTPDVTQVVKAPVGWAKAKPVVFSIFVLLVILLTIRYRDKIAMCLAKIPVLGPWLTGLARVATVVVGLISLGVLQ